MTDPAALSRGFPQVRAVFESIRAYVGKFSPMIVVLIFLSSSSSFCPIIIPICLPKERHKRLVSHNYPTANYLEQLSSKRPAASRLNITGLNVQSTN